MRKSKPKTIYPVSSYSAQLFEVLRQGARGPITLNFPTEKMAIHFTHRINSLRTAMRREDYTDWQEFYRAGVYPHPTDPKIRIVRPRDSEFDEYLTQAGVKDPGADAPQQDTNSATTGDPAEDFLASLRKPKLEDL